MNRRQELDDRIGTCPVCWGEFKVRDDDADGRWSLALHGYLRPGDGYIRGQCVGTEEEPLEHSPSGLKAAIAQLKIESESSPSSHEQRTFIEERLQFAERELANWSRRAIPGIDTDPVPFHPRRPPDAQEIRDRLRLAVPLHGSLERAKREEVEQASSMRPPRVEITLRIPDPVEGRLRAARQRVAELKPKARPGVRPGPLHKDDLPDFRRWREADLALSIEEDHLAIERDRHRLALGKTVSSWLTKIAAAARRPQSSAMGGVLQTIVIVEPTTWETIDRLTASLAPIGTRQDSARRSSWNVEADDLRVLSQAIGVDLLDPARMKSTLKAPEPFRYVTWDSLRTWNGESGWILVSALNWFNARVDEVEWLWRFPDGLLPFLDPAGLARQPVAVDTCANAIYRDRRGIWRLEPIEGFQDHAGLSADEADEVQSFYVIGVSKDRLALIPEMSGDRYGGYTIVPVAQLLEED